METRLDAARRALGKEIGGMASFTATGGSTTTAIIPSVFDSDSLPASALAHAWLFGPTVVAPQQRRINADGLTPTNGTITLDGALGSAVTASMLVEIHSRLPATSQPVTANGLALVLGLHEALNLALRHLLLLGHSYALSVASGTHEFTLPSWLDRPSRLVDVRDPNALGTGMRSTHRLWEFRRGSAGTNTIYFREPYPAAGEVELVTNRPADTLISGADSSAGLVAEADTCEPALNDLVKVAKAFCYQALRDTRRGASALDYGELYANQIRVARTAYGYDETNDIDPAVPTAAAAA